MSPVGHNGVVDTGNAFPWRFLTPLLLGSALLPINGSMIATALVPIAAAVEVPVGQATVLVAALYLTSAIAQPTWGKLAEQFGPRRVFAAGMVTVLVGGVVGGLGRDVVTLTVARVLIGAGTSTGYPSAMLLIRRRAQQADLAAPPGGVLGALQISAMAISTVGLPLGGVLVATVGWRAIFWINIPVALIALVMAVGGIAEDAAIGGRKDLRGLATRVDVVGIAGFAAGMIALLVFLFSLPHLRWPALGLAAVLFAGLVGWELRACRPFIDVRLLVSNVALTGTYLRYGLSALCLYTALYGLTQWLQAARGLSAETAGLLIVPMSALSALLSVPVSRRNLLRGPLVMAGVASLAGSVGVVFLTSGSPLVLIVAITLVFGVTMGTASVGNQAALYSAAETGQIATASGLFRTFSSLGNVGASALVGIIFHREVADHGLHLGGFVVAVVSALVLLLTITDRRVRTQRRATMTPTGGRT